jgi:hypothetical protein
VSSKAASPSSELDLDLLHAILRVTTSARLRAIIRELLTAAPRTRASG